MAIDRERRPAVDVGSAADLRGRRGGWDGGGQTQQHAAARSAAKRNASVRLAERCLAAGSCNWRAALLNWHFALPEPPAHLASRLSTDVRFAAGLHSSMAVRLHTTLEHSTRRNWPPRARRRSSRLLRLMPSSCRLVAVPVVLCLDLEHALLSVVAPAPRFHALLLRRLYANVVSSSPILRNSPWGTLR